MTEGNAQNHIVDEVTKQSVQFSTKAYDYWKKIKGNKQVLFRHNLTKPGRFLTNFVFIPGPIEHTTKRPNRVRGRPSKLFDRKKHRAQQYARAKVRDAADNDFSAILSTARADAKNAGENEWSYILKQLQKDPSLKTFVVDQIKKKKRGIGRYTLL